MSGMDAMDANSKLSKNNATVSIILRIRQFFAIPGSLSFRHAQAITPPINPINIGNNHQAALGFPPYGTLPWELLYAGCGFE